MLFKRDMVTQKLQPHNARTTTARTMTVSQIVLALTATSMLLITANNLFSEPAYCSPSADTLLDDKKPNGAPMLDKIHAYVSKFKDYKFHSAIKTYKGAKTNNMEGDFFYKKAKNVRVEVTSGGIKKGTVVVRNADGIKAKMGGGLLGFKVSLTEDSRMLLAPNGFNVVHSDLGSLLSQLKERVASGMVVRSSDGPIPVPGMKGTMLVVEVIQPKPAEKVVERLCIDPKDLASIHWDIFKQDQLFSTFEVADFKGDVNLDEKLFTM
jgi:hypothetical protein